MKILVVGNLYLADAFKKDNDVLTVGIGPTYDIAVNDFFCDFKTDICARFPRNFVPDVVLLFEGPQQIFPIGIEDTDLPIGWYAMDTHVNQAWHLDYAAPFDYLFVAQKDYIPLFRKETSARIHFSPLTCDPRIHKRIVSDKKYDFTFVGTVKEDYYNRMEYLDFFKKQVSLNVFSHVFGEEMNRLFNQSKIVLNHPIQGDLNFRVFEALASGSCLLTPRTGNGLTDLFVDGEDCVMFDPNDLSDGVKKGVYYLNHPEERIRIAEKGYERVMRYHTREKRAEEMLAFIKEHPIVKKRQSHVCKRLAKAYYIIDQLIFSFSHKRRYEGKARDASIVLLKKQINETPDDPESYYLLGMSYVSMGRREEALTLFEKSLALDAHFIPASVGLGVLFLSKKDHDRAAIFFQEAHALNSERTQILLEGIYIKDECQSSGYVNLGHIYVQVNDFNRAIYYFKKGLALNPNDVPLLISLGFTYLKNGEKKTASTFLDKALALDPESEQVKKLIARALDGA